MKFITRTDFITSDDVATIKSYEKPSTEEIQNYHIKSVNDAIKGWSIMKDFGKTEITREVTHFQGDGTVVDYVPEYFEHLGYRIAKSVGVSAENMFFQYIVVGAGGQIRKHYDVGKPGYVTYKCNVCVEGPADDVVHVGNETMSVAPLSLYCFEANLYKHWMGSSDVPRIHLSYGYIVPYVDLGWDRDCARVRLSDRIWKAYIDRTPNKL